MTKEDLITLKKSLKAEEDKINNDLAALSKEKSALHKKLRSYYQEYIDEHFPIKPGEKAKYTFVNSDGDIVIREITITDINGYNCNLNEITVSYKYNGDRNDVIWGVDINGGIVRSSIPNSKLEKI